MWSLSSLSGRRFEITQFTKKNTLVQKDHSFLENHKERLRKSGKGEESYKVREQVLRRFYGKITNRPNSPVLAPSFAPILPQSRPSPSKSCPIIPQSWPFSPPLQIVNYSLNASLKLNYFCSQHSFRDMKDR